MQHGKVVNTLAEVWRAGVTVSKITQPRDHISSECLGWKSLAKAREVSQARPRLWESQASILRIQSPVLGFESGGS